ncbi:MAG: glutamate--tRNA ligase [Clostridiales bacterium GWF2_38_85]|nr:MAG: glutamate--tRNA ligase [Clostridiales bacterium GWF2_38_85]HBL84065.1 glutamate--tRNA ligase [Clostridiales bacterium]
MDYRYLAELLYPDVKHDYEYYESLYPVRNLPEGAKVTRIAPSPTGYVHFGSIFPALVSERLARQSGGVFYLRIEDTDEKRKVKGAIEDIIKSFDYFGINFDEGVTLKEQKGNYEPYIQSQRVEIYHTFAKKLVSEGKAFPCFCSEETIENDKQLQAKNKEMIGYYGKYAHCINLTCNEIEKKIKDGKKFVLRFLPDEVTKNNVTVTDLIRGAVTITDDNTGRILIKSDGVPTYHFAHAVDDHLMRTTHVVRGEEWLSSVIFNMQLFLALGFKPPKYMHISTLMTIDGVRKKKLSKRDKGSGLKEYIKNGYAAESVVEYVLTLLNSNYEDWRRANPELHWSEFSFSIKKMGSSGSLFDFAKLNDVSKNVISNMTALDVYNRLIAWASKFDKEFYEKLSYDKEYAIVVLSIGRGGPKSRKDFAVWSELRHYMSFFYDNWFEITDKINEKFSSADIIAALKKFASCYNENDTQDIWFGKIKDIAASLNYCPDMKLYKQNPEAYQGNVGDISMFIRVAVTGRINSPDLYTVMQVLGKERVIVRLKSYCI